MVVAGLLVAIASIVGMVAKFPLFGGNVYLVGLIIFMMPILLRIDFAIISMAVSVVITDLMAGWIYNTWISIIAYLAAVIIIWGFNKIPILNWVALPVGFVVASGATIIIYFVMEYAFIDKSIAFSDTLATLVQFAIIIPALIIVHRPLKMLSKLYI